MKFLVSFTIFVLAVGHSSFTTATDTKCEGTSLDEYRNLIGVEFTQCLGPFEPSKGSFACNFDEKSYHDCRQKVLDKFQSCMNSDASYFPLLMVKMNEAVYSYRCARDNQAVDEERRCFGSIGFAASTCQVNEPGKMNQSKDVYCGKLINEAQCMNRLAGEHCTEKGQQEMHKFMDASKSPCPK